MIYDFLCKQIRASLDLEERMPIARFYFSEDVHMIARNNDRNCIVAIVASVLESLLNTSFDTKVKALQESNEKSENLIEEYQVTMMYYGLRCIHAISERKPDRRG